MVSFVNILVLRFIAKLHKRANQLICINKYYQYKRVRLPIDDIAFLFLILFNIIKALLSSGEGGFFIFWNLIGGT